MMPSATTGNFRPSRRFACDRCRSFKLRCQRDDALGQACERCAKTSLPCTTTFEHTSQRQSLANRLSQSHSHNHNHQQNHQQNANGIEKPAPAPAAVTEARPSPPEERDSAAQRRDDGRGRFDINNAGQPPRRSSSPPDRHDEPNGTGWNPLPSPAGETRPRPVASASKEQLTTSETNGLARHWAEAGERMLLDHNSLGLDGMDFAIPDFPFDSGDYDFSRLIDTHHPASSTEVEAAGVDRHRRGGSEGVSGIFGHHDDDLGLNGAATELIGRPSLSRHGNMGDDGPLSSTVETGRHYDPRGLPSTSGAAFGQVSQPLNSYIGLLKLSLELAEDQSIIETQAPLDAKLMSPPPECPPAEQSRFINRVLNQSARFSDILKNMSTEVEPQQQRTGNGSNGIGGRSSNGASIVNGRGNGHNRGFDSGVWLGSTRSMTSDAGVSRVDMDLFGMTVPSSSGPTAASAVSQRVDHVLVVNLVMTYVYLLRSCRAVFARLYQALEMTAAAESQSAVPALRLPSMQFGDFQLDNNLGVQVKVLVEMMSGMLLRIGSTLGISPAGIILPANGNASPPAEDRDYRLPFMNDPLAVSVREIILSQERAQVGEGPPLREILSNLRRLLERRYCV